jgi:hypothetical protein
LRAPRILRQPQQREVNTHVPNPLVFKHNRVLSRTSTIVVRSEPVAPMPRSGADQVGDPPAML